MRTAYIGKASSSPGNCPTLATGADVVSYWRLFYHLVWSTHCREPLIDRKFVQLLTRSIHATCITEGAQVHALSFMPDHVHLAVSIPPRISIAGFMKQIKGSSSHLLNARGSQSANDQFKWQQGYGVISFDERSLERIAAYVNNQVAHHVNDDLWAAFELEEWNSAATSRD
jgi:putative transposase